VALESERAGAYVVGEDLGTVEDAVRRELAYRRILSYRVMWFEDRPTSAYPARALATVTTHDLPTIAGVWSGADLKVQRELGLRPNEAGTASMRRMLVKLAGSRKAPLGQVIAKTHEALSRAPSALVAATLEDAIGVEPRPNMPGTTDQYPSWCIPLPKTLEQIKRDPLALRVARALGKGRKKRRKKR
jgi:4-alpha-glucanotransferase